jgi:uncharacterized protein (DUF427 family)
MASTIDTHPIRVETNPKRVRVRLGGRVIADTTRALTLFEASYPGVRYIPRADVDMGLLERSRHTTTCPYKGLASYFSIIVDGRRAENAIWTYESPKPVAAQIKDHLAFDLRHVEVIEDAVA